MRANFSTTGNSEPKQRTGRRAPARSSQTIAAVGRVVMRNPRISQRRLAAAVGTSQRTIGKIQKQDLHLSPYKFQMVQGLKPPDYGKGLKFVRDMEENFTSFNNIIFSDEGHFHLNGVINQQNCQYWSERNPHLTLKTQLHPEKVTVWAGLAPGES